ncbi:MAG: amino acid adenylation domain-containing protein, partial [Chloroflexi bacterium]|nr:amino acid adenylation domain-containing protein [Chloroflexota bacterium]
AGGVSISLPHGQGYVHTDGSIYAPDGHCRAFDADAAGTVVSNGAAIVVLKRLTDAIEDGDNIVAVIKGSAINNDGAKKVGYTAPSVQGQAQVIRQALHNAGVTADTIGYVETHGTGTKLGDPVEVAALTEAFGASLPAHSCAISSLKTNMGHLNAAAGAGGLIRAALALNHHLIPPNLHFQTPNPALKLDETPFYVPATAQPWETNGRLRRASVSSFGLGGTNAHAILEEAPAKRPSSPSRPYQPLLLSAKSETALAEAVDNLASYLQDCPPDSLADVAYTLQVGRQSFPHRWAVILPDGNTENLTPFSPEQIQMHQVTEAPNIVFMFPGGGAQYGNMGRGLYETEPVYRRCLDDCLAQLTSLMGTELKPLLFPVPDKVEAADRALERPLFSFPSTFITAYAMAQLWLSWGVQPAAVTGHSMGEYVAAVLAGVMSLEDALSLVVLRAQLFESTEPGAMLSVPLSEAEISPYLTPHMAIAAVNAPNLCVVSGPVEEIVALETKLSEMQINGRRIRTAVATHSPLLDPILDTFHQRVAQIELHPPNLPFISNVSGTWATDELTDPAYWVTHLRQQVRFAAGLAELLQTPNQLFLEVGPGQTLSSLTRMQPKEHTPTFILSSMRHRHDDTPDVQFVLTILAKLWLAGAPIDWAGFYAAETRNRVSLPTYPFQRQRYWIEPRAMRFAKDNNNHVAPLAVADVPIMPPTTSKFDITVYAEEKQKGIEVSLVCNRNLYQPQHIRTLLNQYVAILKQASQQFEQPLATISLHTPATAPNLPDPSQPLATSDSQPLSIRFAAQVQHTPNAIAITTNNQKWTYAQVHEHALKVAANLRTNNVKPGDVVGILAQREPTMVWAILGVWYSGARFVVLNPAYPTAYLERIVAQTQPCHMLRLSPTPPLPQVTQGLSESVLTTTDLPSTQSHPPLHQITGEDGAYIAFTSGTTGEPRGINGNHAPPAHFVEWQIQQFALTANDRFSLLSGLAHDPLLRDIFTPLTIGATLCIPTAEHMEDGSALSVWLSTQKITSVHITPALCELLTQATPNASLPALQHVFLGGEQLPVSVVLALQSIAKNAQIVNFYGATETPQAIAYHVVEDVIAGGRIAIGCGIDNVQLLVCNGSHMAGVGEQGEVYVRTPYLANGYWQDEMLTAQKFVINPWGDTPVDRMYRTGDIGFYQADGNVVLVGRSDTQVNIRGYRIDPSMVDEVLVAHTAVATSVTLAVPHPSTQELQLVTCVVKKLKNAMLDSAEILTYIAQQLPDHFVPNQIVFIETIPLTPNNKVDYDQLIAVATQPVQTQEMIAPRNEIESKIAAIWRQLLGVTQLSRFDDFFDLGGHSLIGTQLLSRLKQQFMITVPTQFIFNHRTIAAQAAFITQSQINQTEADSLDDLFAMLDGMSDEEAAILLNSLPTNGSAMSAD